MKNLRFILLLIMLRGLIATASYVEITLSDSHMVFPWETNANIPMGRYISLEQRVAAMRLVQSYEDSSYCRIIAERTVKKIEANPSSSDEEKKAAKALREILAQPWAEKRDADALRQRCLDALKGEHSDEYGMPVNEPAVVWTVLSNLARDPAIDVQKWKPVLDLAIERGFTSKDVPGGAASIEIIAIPRIADELLPTSFFASESHFMKWDPQKADIRAWSRLLEVSAQTLARRGEFELLVELGWKFPWVGRYDILQALAYPKLGSKPGPRLPGSENEEKYWAFCLKQQPYTAFQTLWSHQLNEHNPFNETVRQPLRERLLLEAEESQTRTKDFNHSSAGYTTILAMKFLATFKNEEDTPVFEKLLEYRGYQDHQRTRDGKDYIERRYEVRDAAKQILLQRGVPVPQDLVLKKEIYVH